MKIREEEIRKKGEELQANLQAVREQVEKVQAELEEVQEKEVHEKVIHEKVKELQAQSEKVEANLRRLQNQVKALEKEIELQEKELGKEIEKRDKEKWISENPEYRETHEMIELAKKAEAGEATEKQREILRQWAEKSITSSVVYEDSVDYASDGGNTSDEDLSGKEGKASESQSSSTSSSVSSLSNSTSSSTSTALPEEIINLASIREVYSKFKAKGDDWDTDDDEAFGLQDKYFQYLDILRRQLNDRESGKDKIEKILEEFYKDCASNDIAKTDFWDIIYQTHNEDLIMLSLLNLAARKVKDDFLEVIKIPAHSDIEIYFKAFLKIQNEGKFNQITLNESIKNQQDNLLSVMDQVVKALSISIDSQEDENSDDDAGRDGNTSDEDLSGKEGKAKEGKASESQSSSTSSSATSLSDSMVSEVTIGSVLSEVAAMPDTGGFSELAGDSTETGDHLAG